MTWDEKRGEDSPMSMVAATLYVSSRLPTSDRLTDEELARGPRGVGWRGARNQLRPRADPRKSAVGD